MVRLTGANSIPVSASRHQPQFSNSMEFSNLNSLVNSNHNSVFNSIKKDPKVIGHNHTSNATLLAAGILGPIPDPSRVKSGNGPLLRLCSKCLSSAHSRIACRNNFRCRRCLCFGHVSSTCDLPPSILVSFLEAICPFDFLYQSSDEVADQRTTSPAWTKILSLIH
jgi:hypothetical protein